MTTRRPPRPPSDRDAPRGGRSGRTPTGRGSSRGDTRAEGRDGPRSDTCSGPRSSQQRASGLRSNDQRGETRGDRSSSNRGNNHRNDGPRAEFSRGERSVPSRGRDDRRPEGPRSDTRRSDAPRRDDRRSEGPPSDTRRSDAPRRDDRRSEGPRSDTRRSDTPRRDDRRSEGPPSDTRRSDTPRRDDRRFDARPNPATNSPKTAPRKTPARARRTDTDDGLDSEGDPINGPQRIAKLLARAGVGSRRDVERMIEEGRIALKGEVIAHPAPLLSSLEGLSVDGVPVEKPVSTRLYRFYKPVGCLTAARDPKGRKTIYDVLPDGLPRLMPVGRLDYNTEGLLLMTNDGEFKRKLELPASGVERTYRARAFGDVSQAQWEELVLGVEIDGIRYGKIDANLERRTGRNQWIELTLTEGKNREVRNVLEHLGLQVSRLIRVRYGEFSIDGLEVGDVDVVPRDLLFQFRRLLG